MKKKIEYNYKFICEDEDLEGCMYTLDSMFDELGTGRKTITIFNKNSSLQDILKDKTILEEIEIYYGEDWKEEDKCNLIVDYMQNMIIVKYKID